MGVETIHEHREEKAVTLNDMIVLEDCCRIACLHGKCSVGVCGVMLCCILCSAV